MTTRPDDADLAALYGQYGGLVFRTCRSILGDHHDAEDAAQEVFAKLLTCWDATAVREERRWLLQVTRNHCYDRLRASARRPTVPVDGEQVVACSADDPEQRSLLRAHVRWLLSLLPDRQREVMVRQAVLDEDLDTVADRLGLSYGAAAQLMYRARRMLVHAGDSSRAGIAVLGARLAGLRARLRDLGSRLMSGGRELVSRGPLFDAAVVALPLALIAAVLGAGPQAGGAAAGRPSSTATLAAVAMAGPPRSAAGSSAALASAATVLRNQAAPSPPPVPNHVKVVLRGAVHLPQPPPQAGPVVQCQQIGAWQTCPYPSSVPLMQTLVVRTSVPISLP